MHNFSFTNTAVYCNLNVATQVMTRAIKEKVVTGSKFSEFILDKFGSILS